MSQAVIDFCEGLKTTLLSLEDKLGKAKAALEVGAVQASAEARKHLDDATEQLNTFKVHAGVMAEAIRADLPQQTAIAREKLKDFGQEAQVAMRHAMVFIAEAAAKGAEGTAGALQAGAKSAQRMAETLKHETAMTATEPDKTTPPA